MNKLPPQTPSLGVNSRDLSDGEISKIISGIPKVLNNRDDIMIGGQDWGEHNKSLAQLLQRLEDHNLTLPQAKCEFGTASIDFHDTCLHKKVLNQAQPRFKLSKTLPLKHPKRNLYRFSKWRPTYSGTSVLSPGRANHCGSSP